jgi:ppGpp synthetase/RelA/SpoT-type nucleotidyltranferase
VDLLMDRQLVLLTKPYDSILDKALRRNVLENNQFPSPPKDGWFEPSVWFQLNNDIVRSVLTCKYMDGPQFLAERLRHRANALGLGHRSKSQQNDDGYYAYHFYAKIPVELTKPDWTTEIVPVEVEIQITTQLQEVLRALTHRVYEHRRLAPHADAHAWKRDRDSERFHAAYLGHTLHMLEAIILDLRGRGAKS